MRRTIALLVGVAAGLVIVAPSAAASPGAPSANSAGSTPSGNSSSTVPADAVDLTLSQVAGSGLAVTLDAGGTEEHDIVVSNHTANLRLTIKLTATDATGRLGGAAAAWLAFGDDAIELDPHAAVTVPMTIAVPHDTQPGSALAHVNATVQSAVAAADGTPVGGTATRTFPVSISVSGTPTAQIAVADVHRVDQGSTHQLAVVLRNFGARGAQVTGHVRVAGDQPQTLPFHANLEPSRDTTVDLDWSAPRAGSASDLAVDVEYGAGNVASWSSRLGGSPTDLNPQTATPTTAAAVASAVTPASTSSAPEPPWWKRPWALALGALALLGAIAWFVFEMRASRPAYATVPPRAGRVPVGGSGPAADDSLDLVQQVVRLTDVVVQLVAAQREGWERVDGRSRGPDEIPAAPPTVAPRPTRSESADTFAIPRESFAADDVPPARAGPDPPVTVAASSALAQPIHTARPAPPTSGAPARPDPVESRLPVEPTDAARELDAIEAHFVDEDEPDNGRDERHVEGHVGRRVEGDVGQPSLGPTPIDPTAGPGPGPVDPRAAVIERLVELDRQRRRLREWMDAEDSGAPLEPPARGEVAGQRAGRPPGAAV